jgi:hypothetical protein
MRAAPTRPAAAAAAAAAEPKATAKPQTRVFPPGQKRRKDWMQYLDADKQKRVAAVLAGKNDY